MSAPVIRRAFADLSVGQVHHACCGDPDAPAVLFLHQTPRSWAEYREVLPRVGRRYRAIAMDTVGFGDSAPAPWPPTIERWAQVALELLDVLQVRRAHLVGHHTGGVIAVELAAAFPQRVGALVLSSTPFTDEPGAPARAARRSMPSSSAPTARTSRRCGASARRSTRRAGRTCSRPSCATR